MKLKDNLIGFVDVITLKSVAQLEKVNLPRCSNRNVKSQFKKSLSKLAVKSHCLKLMPADFTGCVQLNFFNVHVTKLNSYN